MRGRRVCRVERNLLSDSGTASRLSEVKTQVGKLASVQLGLRLGSSTPKVLLKVYVDLACSASAHIFGSISKEVLPAYQGRPVAFVFHQQVRSCCFQSCVMHEVWAAIKCMGVAPEVEVQALQNIFDHQVAPCLPSVPRPKRGQWGSGRGRRAQGLAAHGCCQPTHTRLSRHSFPT